MTAKSHARASRADGVIVRAAKAWDHFWFAPQDPTTLAVIRILAGVITLYVHLAYSYDLHEFFGKDAWYSLQMANAERREAPRVGPTSGWYGDHPSLPPIPDPDARAGMLKWIRQVVDDPDPLTRARIARLLDDPQTAPDAWGQHAPPAYALTPASSRFTVAQFLRELPADQTERERILGYLERWGLDPRQLTGTGSYYWSIWYHVSAPGWMVFIHCIVLLAILMFTLGLCTRITAVLTWLGALSYLQRSPMTLFGGDTMMNILLIYLMIGPSGAALSLDRLIARWWVVRRARQQGLPIPDPVKPQPSVSANFALRLLQIHFCIIYFAAGSSKLLGGAWWNGQAIYYTMVNYEFAPMHRTYYLGVMRFLAQHRWLWEIVMEGGSYFTLFLELSFPFLVWNRKLRPYYVCGAFALHTAIGLVMGLITFSLLMATMVLGFVPGDTMRWLLGWRKEERAPAGETETESKEEAEEDEPPAKSTHVKAKDGGRREKEIKN